MTPFCNLQKTVPIHAPWTTKILFPSVSIDCHHSACLFLWIRSERTIKLPSFLFLGSTFCCVFSWLKKSYEQHALEQSYSQEYCNYIRKVYWLQHKTISCFQLGMPRNKDINFSTAAFCLSVFVLLSSWSTAPTRAWRLLLLLLLLLLLSLLVATAWCTLRVSLLRGLGCLDLVVEVCCGGDCVVDFPFDELAISTFNSSRRCNFAFFEQWALWMRKISPILQWQV